MITDPMARDVIDLVHELAPIVAAVASVFTVYLGRTIHTLVNSAATALREDLRVANAHIVELQTWMVMLKAQQALPAGTQTEVPAGLMLSPAPPPTVPKP